MSAAPELSFVVPGPLEQLTGGYLFDAQIIEGLRKRGWAPRVVELPGRFPDADPQAQRAATAWIESLAPGARVVIDGLALPAFERSLARHAPRLRIVALVHHPLSLETGLPSDQARHYAALEARLWPLLRGILCPSRSSAEAVVAAGVPRERVRMAPPGTEPALGQARGKAPGSAPIQLLSVGTVTARKGHRLLVEALAQVRELRWRLRCIGSLERDPETVQALRQAMTRHGLTDRIELMGEQPRETLLRAYAEAQIFVLPSYYEGYGMAYAEALAHGLPVIATTGGSIPETVPTQAAVLIEPGDVAALGAALRQLIEDPVSRERLAEGARRAARSLPDWAQATAHWVQAFEALAS